MHKKIEEVGKLNYFLILWLRIEIDIVVWYGNESLQATVREGFAIAIALSSLTFHLLFIILFISEFVTTIFLLIYFWVLLTGNSGALVKETKKENFKMKITFFMFFRSWKHKFQYNYLPLLFLNQCPGGTG